MQKSKDKNSNSHSKNRKKLRETNSYKVLFKSKNKRKTNLDNKDNTKSKSKNKNKYSDSNISAKTYIQKQKSSLINEYNSCNQLNNNKAVSYSNYAFSEMEQSKRNENNIFNESSKYNEDVNTLINSNNYRMDIADLNNTNNKKSSGRRKQKSNDRINNINSENFQNNNFSKKAAYSVLNENEKIIENNTYNISSTNNRYNYENIDN